MFKCLDSILRTMKSILMDFKHKTILMFFQRSLWFMYIMGGVICPCFSCCSTIFKDQFYCESWTIKKAECRSIDAFWTVVLEKTLECPLDCKEIQPVHPKGNQSWIFIGKTDAETEAPILWPCDVKNWLTWKDPDTGKDWRQEEKGMTEDEMVGWHHWLNGHEFE